MSTAETTELDPNDYAKRVSIGAPQIQVFDAVASTEGLRSWWTPLTSGSADVGGEIRFDFAGLDEPIIMRVDESQSPTSVQWTCLTNVGHPEWEGTTLTFAVEESTAESCELNFRHAGLRPALQCYDQCHAGWDHFLASLAASVEHGAGTPFAGVPGDRFDQ